MDKINQNQNPYLIPGILIISALLISGAILIAGKTDKVPIAVENIRNSVGQEVVPVEEADQIINIEIENWPSMGDPDAPVTIVEYSDYACPFCGRHFEETLPLIKENYIETGKVYYVYKDFTVVGGDRAAEAAHCAGEQGKYWEYHDLLYERQEQDRAQWSNVQIHSEYAQQLGLDQNSLAECFEGRRYQEKIIQSTQEAAQNGGEGTPYFLINGRPVSGAQPYSEFQTIIDDLLLED